MARVTIEIPKGANREGLSIEANNIKEIVQASQSRVWINGKEISGCVTAFAVVKGENTDRLMLELVDFEIYEADEILDAVQLG